MFLQSMSDMSNPNPEIEVKTKEIINITQKDRIPTILSTTNK